MRATELLPSSTVMITMIPFRYSWSRMSRPGVERFGSPGRPGSMNNRTVLTFMAFKSGMSCWYHSPNSRRRTATLFGSEDDVFVVGPAGDHVTPRITYDVGASSVWSGSRFWTVSSRPLTDTRLGPHV